MRRSFYKHVWAVVACWLLVGCFSEKDESSANLKEMLVYCGITMVKPIQELAEKFGEINNVRITISQGGSEDLYQSAKVSGVGDIYLPGSESYRKKHLSEGLLLDSVHVGFNQAAIAVKRGNPKNVKADVTELLRDDISLVICNPESGSIGRETKNILSSAGIYDKAFNKSSYLTTDSKNLNFAIKKGDADVTINWRATAFFAENSPYIEVVDLPANVAKPKKLVMNLLKFSEDKEMARKFMAYVASPEGQAVFRKYGFLDSSFKYE